MATDLAEFLGAAIGFQLLLRDRACFPSTVITGIAAFAILGLQRFGFRPFEAVIAAIVGVIGVCYLIELIFANPDLAAVGQHAVVPQLRAARESVLLAVGILGATVMPHVIYLHSALTQDRIVAETDEDARRLLRYTRVDVLIAMAIAGLINISMLVMAASTFYGSGLPRRRLARERARDARADPRPRPRARSSRSRCSRRASRPRRSGRSPARS